jgi:hypothetical protein
MCYPRYIQVYTYRIYYVGVMLLICATINEALMWNVIVAFSARKPRTGKTRPRDVMRIERAQEFNYFEVALVADV